MRLRLVTLLSMAIILALSILLFYLASSSIITNSYYLMPVVIAFGLLFAAVPLLILERLVRRLSNLIHTVNSIGANHDFSHRIAINGHDDISALAASINGMLSGLETSRRALTESDEKLRNNNRMLQSLVEASPLAIVLLDIDGTVRLWNAAAETLFGWTVNESIGQFHPLMNKDGKDEIFALFSLALKGHCISGIELLRCKKDDTPIHVNVSLAPLYDDAGQVTGVMQVLADITERKKTEEFKKRLEAHLAQSQKMEAIGRLVGSITHDFNNLLTVILGNLDLAMMDLEQDATVTPVLNEVRSAAVRAVDLTNRLLLFSRKQVPVSRILNLNEVVSGMQKMLVRLAGEEVRLTVDLEPAPGNVKADPGQMEQLVMNLVVNARNAMPQGGQLSISTAAVVLDDEFCRKHPAATPGPHMLLVVADTGVGMDDEVKKHLFEPFFTTRKAGTGFGLSIVWAVVKNHHGIIDVQSEVDKGTSFHVYFPCSVESESEFSSVVEAPVTSGREATVVVNKDAHE